MRLARRDSIDGRAENRRRRAQNDSKTPLKSPLSPYLGSIGIGCKRGASASESKATTAHTLSCATDPSSDLRNEKKKTEKGD